MRHPGGLAPDPRGEKGSLERDLAGLAARLEGPDPDDVAGDRLGRPRVVCQLALYRDPPPGLAALFADQPQRQVSLAALQPMADAEPAGHPARPGVERPGSLLQEPTGAGHPAGALGARLPRGLAAPDRAAS